MKVNMPIGWIQGHLRYGHLEGEVDFTKEQENEFKSLLKRDLNKEELTSEEEDKLDEYVEWIRDDCDIIVDDYRIDDYGDFGWSELLKED